MLGCMWYFKMALNFYYFFWPPFRCMFAIASYHGMLLVLDLVCCFKNFNVSNAKFIKNGENVENLSLTISLVFKAHHQSPLNVNNNVPIIVNHFHSLDLFIMRRPNHPLQKISNYLTTWLWEKLPNKKEFLVISLN